MASKLNFRARTLDASKPMAIYHADELPELTDLNAINRSVPAMPSGMEKEEESEKHLQDILDAQNNRDKKDLAETLVIPTPEVFEGETEEVYNSLYSGDYKVPRTYIHVQPFNADSDLPDYDMDDEDDCFLEKVLRGEKKFEVDAFTFEAMLDRLEKNSGNSVIEPQEAKQLLKEDDDLILAVYDYWVDKRLRLKKPLMPTVKSDKKDFGSGTVNSNSQSGGGGTNPYIAFRRRTEKMQTRKNRKNDEVSYEKMFKLRRDFIRAIGLLDLVKRREKIKKEHLMLTAEIFERRYQVGDFEGKVFEDVRRQTSRVLQQQNSLNKHPYGMQDVWLGHPGLAPANMATGHPTGMVTKERRRHPSKKKKLSKSQRRMGASSLLGGLMPGGTPEFGTGISSDDDLISSVTSHSDMEEDENEGIFGFRRKRNCQYLRPLSPDDLGSPGFQGIFSLEDVGAEAKSSPKTRYYYGSLSSPKARYLGLIRRRVGRGGRVVLDRIHAATTKLAGAMNGVSDPFDDSFYSAPLSPSEVLPQDPAEPHFRPVTPPHCRDDWDGGPEFTLFGLPKHPVKPTQQLFHRTGSQGRHRTSSGVSAVKPVPVDSVGAQNAASAVVTSDVLGIFGSVRN